MKLLVIEDSSRLRRSLEQGFKKAGFSVRLTGDGKDGLAMLDADEYDVVVLDLMLPGMPGLEVLQRLRREGRDTHVLILSAKDQVSDRIRALELGADDYLVKPFSFDELCARVNALVRRRYHAKNPRIVLGHVEIDTARKSVTVGGHVEHLTPSEYALLELLVLRRGRVTSQAQIVDHLYHSDQDVSSNVVEVLVSGLRKKIHRPDLPDVVTTRRGLGYIVE